MEISEKTLARLLETLNKHIPVKKRNLKEIMGEKEPAIKARDGSEYIINKEELAFIAGHVDKADWNKFSIPVILEMHRLETATVAYVRDELHQKFINKAFGFDRFANEAMLLYLYEVRMIRRKLRTASQVLFT